MPVLDSFAMDAPTISQLILRQKIFALVFIVFFMILTIELIRRRALKERYAILWVVASFVLIPIVMSHKLVAKISGLLGIAYVPLTILLTGILFLILINLHFSVALSRHRENEIKLTTKLTEQQEKIEALEKRMKELEGEDSDNPDDTEQ